MGRDETQITARRRQPPAVPGMETVRLLGLGGGSAVWMVKVTGSGSSAVRWTVPEAELGDRLALKVSTGPSTGEDPASLRRRVEAELEAMRPLHHEHIVTACGVAQTSHGPGLLLDLYQAGSLHAMGRSAGRLTPGQAITVLTPVAQAVAHMHRLGAAHGDISPGNVLLAPDGRPALSDLGEAQLLGMPRSEAGTEGFSAPERLQGLQSSAGASTLAEGADVYSLGATAWWALTGEPPASGRSRPPLMTLCPDVPAPMTALLEEALCEEPSQRPTAAEFARDLFRSGDPQALDLSDHVDDAVLPELPTRLPTAHYERSRRRRRRRLLAAGAAVVLGGAGWVAWMQLETHLGGDAGGQGAGNARAAETEQDPLAAAREALDAEDAEDALEGIAALRTAALEDTDSAGVEEYTVTDSPAAAADAELIEDMDEADISYSGDPLVIEMLTDPQQSDEPTESEEPVDARVVLEARVSADDFDAGGSVTQDVLLTLSRVDDRWLLEQVNEAEQTDSGGA